MSDKQPVEQQPETFLDKIEDTFADLRNELVKLVGDLHGIHLLTSDAKMQVLSHVAEHFGESGDPNPAPVNNVEPSSNSSTDNEAP